MQIKTLAEILAESQADSASPAVLEKKRSNNNTAKLTKTEIFEQRQSKKAQRLEQHLDNTHLQPQKKLKHKTAIDDDYLSADLSLQTPHSHSKKRVKKRKRFHPASEFNAEPNHAPVYKPPEQQTIKEMLAEVKHDSYANQDSDGTVSMQSNNIAVNSIESDTTKTDNLPSALKAYLRTPEQKQAETDAIKAESRLRWLAFYYLSRREYGKAELKQKLLDKEQDPDKIDALLNEFADKGYQSDYRTTLMLIRESIRKGRGRGRIKQEFYKKKIDMPGNIDELIDMANTESDAFSEFVEEDKDSLVEGVDWLKLAVAARVKKYCDDIPSEQKDKAKQLRFLQYRGFNSDVCFDALNYTLDTLDERF